MAEVKDGFQPSTVTLPDLEEDRRGVFIYAGSGPCRVVAASVNGEPVPVPVATIEQGQTMSFKLCPECRAWGVCDEHGDPAHSDEQLVKCVLES